MKIITIWWRSSWIPFLPLNLLLRLDSLFFFSPSPFSYQNTFQLDWSPGPASPMTNSKYWSQEEILKGTSNLELPGTELNYFSGSRGHSSRDPNKCQGFWYKGPGFSPMSLRLIFFHPLAGNTSKDQLWNFKYSLSESLSLSIKIVTQKNFHCNLLLKL